MRWNEERQIQDIGEAQVEARKVRRDEKCKAQERQARQRQVACDAEERRKAVKFLVLDVEMVFFRVCSTMMQCLSCVACFWDGLGSVDKVRLNRIKFF